jgi:hypothetical protein
VNYDFIIAFLFSVRHDFLYHTFKSYKAHIPTHNGEVKDIINYLKDKIKY